MSEDKFLLAHTYGSVEYRLESELKIQEENEGIIFHILHRQPLSTQEIAFYLNETNIKELAVYLNYYLSKKEAVNK